MVVELTAVKEDTIKRLMELEVEWLVDSGEVVELKGDNEELLFALDRSSGEGEECYLDKSWHALHFCLTGTAQGGRPPLYFFLHGGVAISEDLGYGPMRAFFAERAQAISVRLQNFDLKSKYDPRKMAEESIYPDIWKREDNTNWEYLETNFEKLKSFMKHCARSQLGFIHVMC